MRARVLQMRCWVHRPQSNLANCLDICIDPIGDMYGVANIIQRAEAVAVQHALRVDHPLSTRVTRVIATDSLGVMYMLRKHLRCPYLNKQISTPLGVCHGIHEQARESRQRWSEGGVERRGLPLRHVYGGLVVEPKSFWLSMTLL